MKTLIITILSLFIYNAYAHAECIDSQSLPAFEIGGEITPGVHSVQLDKDAMVFSVFIQGKNPKWTNIGGRPGIKVQRATPKLFELKSGKFLRVATWKECEQ